MLWRELAKVVFALPRSRWFRQVTQVTDKIGGKMVTENSVQCTAGLLLNHLNKLYFSGKKNDLDLSLLSWSVLWYHLIGLEIKEGTETLPPP